MINEIIIVKNIFKRSNPNRWKIINIVIESATVKAYETYIAP